jgi:hypothetical protein
MGIVARSDRDRTVGIIRAPRYSSNGVKKPSTVLGGLTKSARWILPSASTMSYSIAKRDSRKPQFTSDPSSGWTSPYRTAIALRS